MHRGDRIKEKQFQHMCEWVVGLNWPLFIIKTLTTIWFMRVSPKNSEGRQRTKSLQTVVRSEGKRHFFARKKEQADMTHVITCSPQPYIYARILDSNKFSFSLLFRWNCRNQHILIINTQTLNLLYFVGHCNLHLAGSDHDFLMRPKLSLENISVWWRRLLRESLSGSPSMSSLFRMIDYTQRILLASVCLIRRIQFIQWYEWYRRRNKFINFPNEKENILFVNFQLCLTSSWNDTKRRCLWVVWTDFQRGHVCVLISGSAFLWIDFEVEKWKRVDFHWKFQTFVIDFLGQKYFILRGFKKIADI